MWNKKRAKIFNEFLNSVQKAKSQILRDIISNAGGIAGTSKSSLENFLNSENDSIQWIPSCDEAEKAWNYRKMSFGTNVEIITSGVSFSLHSEIGKVTVDEFFSSIHSKLSKKSKSHCSVQLTVPPRWITCILRVAYGFVLTWNENATSRSVIPLVVIEDIIQCANYFKSRDLRSAITCVIQCLIIYVDLNVYLTNKEDHLHSLSVLNEEWWIFVDKFLLMLNKYSFYNEYFKILDFLETIKQEIFDSGTNEATLSIFSRISVKEETASILLQYMFWTSFYPQWKHKSFKQVSKAEKQLIIETIIPDLKSEDQYRHVTYKSLIVCVSAISRVSHLLEIGGKTKTCKHFLKFLQHFYENLRYALCDDIAEVVLWTVSWTGTIRPHPFWRDISNGYMLNNLFDFAEDMISQWNDIKGLWKFKALPRVCPYNLTGVPRPTETVHGVAWLSCREMEELSTLKSFSKPIDFLQEILIFLFESDSPDIDGCVTWSRPMRRKKWNEMFSRSYNIKNKLINLTSDLLDFKQSFFLSNQYFAKEYITEDSIKMISAPCADIFVHVRSVVLYHLYDSLYLVTSEAGRQLLNNRLRDFVENHVDFFTQQPQWGYLSSEDVKYLFLDGKPTVIETIDPAEIPESFDRSDRQLTDILEVTTTDSDDYYSESDGIGAIRCSRNAAMKHKLHDRIVTDKAKSNFLFSAINRVGINFKADIVKILDCYMKLPSF